MNQIQQFTIYFFFQGNKKFLSDFSTRTDNKILPIKYTLDTEEAHIWNTEAAAQSAINKIHNIHDRSFFIEPIMVAEGRAKKIKIIGDEL